MLDNPCLGVDKLNQWAQLGSMSTIKQRLKGIHYCTWLKGLCAADSLGEKVSPQLENAICYFHALLYLGR